MSEPLNPTPNPDPLNPLNADPDGSGEHPRIMMFTNGGILLLGLAALFFCLRALAGLFVVSMVLIVLLALFNLWTLARWSKWWPPRDPVPAPKPGLSGAGGPYTST